MAENLIIYFSHTGENYVNGDIVELSKGNTEIVAEYIQKAVGGTLFRVEAVNDYSNNYRECVKEASRDLKENLRPELKKALSDISQYDNIFVCGPVWCGTYPMPLFSQLERLDFKGKRVLPVVTHEGSGFGFSERDLKRICKGATFSNGLAIHGAEAKDSEGIVSSWAKSEI